MKLVRRTRCFMIGYLFYCTPTSSVDYWPFQMECFFWKQDLLSSVLLGAPSYICNRCACDIIKVRGYYYMPPSRWACHTVCITNLALSWSYYVSWFSHCPVGAWTPNIGIPNVMKLVFPMVWLVNVRSRPFQNRTIRNMNKMAKILLWFLRVLDKMAAILFKTGCKTERCWGIERLPLEYRTCWVF